MIEEREFNTVYHSYGPKVHRICLGYASGNKDLADEWFQETFIKVWKHRKSFQGKSSIETWTYRIAVNVCLGDLRKPRKYIPLSETLLANRANDDDQNHDAQNIQKMYHCIGQLNERNKGLILLELENLPQATIANIVGLTHGTLRTRLSRIRKSLLKCMTNGK